MTRSNGAAVGVLALLPLAAATFVLVRCTSFEAQPEPSSDGGAGDASTGGDAEPPPPQCPAGTAFATDAKNCGVCGRDCGKGACFGGNCSSYVISDGPKLPNPWYIAADDGPDGYVYWTSYDSGDVPGGDGAIRRAPKRGGAVEIVVPPSSFAFDVVVDGDRLVYTTSKAHTVCAISKVPGGAPQVLWTGTRAGNLARVQDRVLFTGATGGTGGVFEIAGSVVQRIATFEETRAPEGIAVTPTTVFWANHNGADGGGSNASVGRVERGGTPLEPDWAALQQNPRLVEVDDTDVYWTSDQTDSVMRKERIGSTPPSPFFTGKVRYGGVVTDGAYAYITVEIDNKVVRVAKNGSSPPLDLATDLQAPLGIRQDSKAIYFVERLGGRVHRLVK